MCFQELRARVACIASHVTQCVHKEDFKECMPCPGVVLSETTPAAGHARQPRTGAGGWRRPAQRAAWRSADAPRPASSLAAPSPLAPRAATGRSPRRSAPAAASPPPLCWPPPALDLPLVSVAPFLVRNEQAVNEVQQLPCALRAATAQKPLQPLHHPSLYAGLRLHVVLENTEGKVEYVSYVSYKMRILRKKTHYTYRSYKMRLIRKNTYYTYRSYKMRRIQGYKDTYYTYRSYKTRIIRIKYGENNVNSCTNGTRHIKCCDRRLRQS